MARDLAPIVGRESEFAALMIGTILGARDGELLTAQAKARPVLSVVHYFQSFSVIFPPTHLWAIRLCYGRILNSPLTEIPVSDTATVDLSADNEWRTKLLSLLSYAIMHIRAESWNPNMDRYLVETVSDACHNLPVFLHGGWDSFEPKVLEDGIKRIGTDERSVGDLSQETIDRRRSVSSAMLAILSR
jgi:hypothetical protein